MQEQLRKFYLCDIDGTLADISHRLHFILEKPQRWDEFFLACSDDKPIWAVIETIKTLGISADIIYVTGRSSIVRKQTQDWLNRFDLPPGPIIMRKHGDHRHDEIVKSELIAGLDLSRIIGVFDDRNGVVATFRNLGLTVFQVADGNF